MGEVKTVSDVWAGDRRLHFEMAGEHGPWVTLVHGGLVHGASWAPLVTTLAIQHRVLVPDLRGYGASDPAPDGYSVPKFSDDVMTLWNHCGVERSAVVGFSMGGFVALELALRAADQVSALILLGTAPAVGEAGCQAFARRAAAVEQCGLADEIHVHLNRVFSNSFRTTNSEAVTAYAAEVWRNRPEVLAATFLALCDFDRTADLGRVRCPSLIIAGEEDAALGVEGSRVLASGLPRASLELVPAAGHTVLMEQPEVVITLIHDFLKSVNDLG